MPVAMTDLVQPNPGQSTQVLPTIPTVEDMKNWDKGKVLLWIQQRHPKLLIGDDLDNFIKARILGIAFLRSSFKVFNENCHLSVGASLGLEALVDLVKEGGEFIPRT